MDLDEDATTLVNNARLSVRETNRGTVILGSPSLSSDGQRRSALTAVIEPLWRENFANLDIVCDATVGRVLLEQQAGGEPVAVGVETKDGRTFHAGAVIAASGCLETPALLMRSGPPICLPCLHPHSFLEFEFERIFFSLLLNGIKLTNPVCGFVSGGSKSSFGAPGVHFHNLTCFAAKQFK